MSGDKTVTGIFGVVTAVVAVIAVLWVRNFLRGIRGTAALPGPYEPVVDPNPPAPVARTRGLLASAWAALGWAGLNVLGGLGWVVVRARHDPLPAEILAAAYIVVGGVLTGVGGAMLLRRRAYGRRMVAWGQVLLALLAALGGVTLALLPRMEKIPEDLRAMAPLLAFLAGLHVAADTAIGAVAQTAGRAAGGGESEPAS